MLRSSLDLRRLEELLVAELSWLVDRLTQFPASPFAREEAFGPEEHHQDEGEAVEQALVVEVVDRSEVDRQRPEAERRDAERRHERAELFQGQRLDLVDDEC